MSQVLFTDHASPITHDGSLFIDRESRITDYPLQSLKINEKVFRKSRLPGSEITDTGNNIPAVTYPKSLSLSAGAHVERQV